MYFNLAPDWRVWSFAAVAATVTGILFGVAPAWQSMRADPIDALREQGRGSVGSRTRWPAVLVSVQVALSLVLVAAAGIFVRTSMELAGRNVGSARDRVLLVNITAPMTCYTLETLVPVYDRVLDRISAVPGVQRAAISDITPASGAGRTSSVEIPGRLQPAGISVNVISPGWLETYGLRPVAGRDLLLTDRANTPAVVLVNDTFSRMFFGGASPLGRTVRVGLLSGVTNVEIVGVVEDAIYRSMRERATPVVYSSTTQRVAARPFVNLSVLAAHDDPARLSRSIARRSP